MDSIFRFILSPVVLVHAKSRVPAKHHVEALWQLWGKALSSQDPQKITALYQPDAILLATFTDKIDNQKKRLSYFTNLMKKVI